MMSLCFQGQLSVPIHWDNASRTNGAIPISLATQFPSQQGSACENVRVLGGPGLIGEQDGTVLFDYGPVTHAGKLLATALQALGCHFTSDDPKAIPSFKKPTPASARLAAQLLSGKDIPAPLKSLGGALLGLFRTGKPEPKGQTIATLAATTLSAQNIPLDVKSLAGKLLQGFQLNAPSTPNPAA